MPKKTVISSAKILKEIDCKFLEMQRGDGYWYFIYDDVKRKVYETCSVYCMYLNQMEQDKWVAIGEDFVMTVETATAEAEAINEQYNWKIKNHHEK